MKQIILVGAGGHCKSCIDIIEQIPGWEIVGVIDKEDSNITEVLGYPVIGCDKNLAVLRRYYEYAFVTVGQIKSVSLRIKLFQLLEKLNYKQPVIISPSSYVSKHASIGKGTVIMHHAVVNAAANIGDNCIINSKALIEHDAVIEDHCHVSTGSIINGGVHVGTKSFVGSQSTSRQNAVIEPEAFIRAGTVML